MTKISFNQANYSYFAVKRQLLTMKAEKYEIGIYDRALATQPGSSPMLIRYWTEAEILKSVGFLKSQNALGKDIFIRPSGSVGMIFFDDLNRAGIEGLKVMGLEPAIVIESSPMNYHGWVRVSDTPIPETLATAACKVIAEQLGGDINSADWRHFGRLAGFTNRKPCHVDEKGHFPFVRVHESAGELCTGHTGLLEQAQIMVERREAERIARVEQLRHIKSREGLEEPGLLYQRELKSLYHRFGQVIDLSRADWTIAKKMAFQGYRPEEIKSVLLEFSPAVEKRAAHAEGYVETTVNNLFSA